MPLSPQSQAIVDAIRAAAPPPQVLGPAGARQASDDRRAGQVRVVEDVAVVRNTTAAGVPVRLYRPAGPTPMPAVVFAHGGGWVLCDLDSHDPMCRILANRTGAAVVSVGYRRAPEDRFPAALDDVSAVLHWVAASAGQLGVDPARLAVAGDSAGGNLAAAAALRARAGGGPALAAQLLLYPVLDAAMDTGSYRDCDGCGVDSASMAWYWDQYAPDPAARADPLAAPARAERLDGLPPAVIAVAEYDPLRDEALAYAARLRASGVPTFVRTYPDSFHGFMSLPSPMHPVVDEAFDEVTAELRRLL
ncbi:alpha/beta hydrolase [Dactylosporangium sp. CS-033363]|uniref:alpha/beta hydrolase n=1 Tax=Dactylosporangium sp. CS-033363 TaxID=3239935 RepID=UPI003D8D2B00